MMHGCEKSDSAVVAVKLANNAERSTAEPVEPRVETEGNVGQQSTHRTQSRVRVSQALDRIREVFAVRTRGKSRMRESCTYGSVRGARGNSRPYRDRREFVRLLGSAAAAWPRAARAQQSGKVPRVGILSPAESDATPIFDAFRKGLRDLGYADGKTIVLDFRFAKGNIDALSGLAAELVRIPVDVIVVDGTSAVRAALDATRTIPIVIGASADPVHLGFVASIRRPGGNITGMTIRGWNCSNKHSPESRG